MTGDSGATMRRGFCQEVNNINGALFATLDAPDCNVLPAMVFMKIQFFLPAPAHSFPDDGLDRAPGGSPMMEWERIKP